MNGNGPFDPRKEAPLLSAYVDGELDAAGVARLEAHLALPDDQSGYAQGEIKKLRRLAQVTASLRLKEPPAEEWEVFWTSVYNRAERSLGWILLSIGLVAIGAWFVTQLVTAWIAAENLPVFVSVGIFAAAAGILVLVISTVRERIFKRRRTRYKDVIR